MKITMVILMMGLLLMACHSEKKMMARRAAYVSTQPVQVTVSETTVEDTLVVEEKPQAPVKTEAVVKTQGADLMHYCVIVGSFIQEQNAMNLRSSLMQEGFLGTSIMRNQEGMFRVSISCDDSHAEASQELTRIRNRYPQYRDAWLLETKN